MALKLVKGVKNLTKQLTKIADATRDMRGPLYNGAVILEEESKYLCPVVTGFLRDSHMIEVVSKNRVDVNVTAYYAKFVEYGTSKMEAQPFLRPAIETKKKEIFQAIGEEINFKLRKGAKL